MTEKKLIWVLEDDAGCQFVLREIFELRYSLRMFSDLTSFRDALFEKDGVKPDLVIADIRLPGQSFLSFLSGDDAKVFRLIPLLVVSSVDDIDALRTCFENGAVDFITKPFTKNELIVKVERIWNQNDRLGQRARREFVLDLPALKVIRGERHSDPLTTKEFQIITILSEAPSGTLSRDEIVSKVWGQVKVTSKAFDVHLYHLRKKLGAVGLEIRFSPPNRYSLLTEAAAQAART